MKYSNIFSHKNQWLPKITQEKQKNRVKMAKKCENNVLNLFMLTSRFFREEFYRFLMKLI